MKKDKIPATKKRMPYIEEQYKDLYHDILQWPAFD